MDAARQQGLVLDACCGSRMFWFDREDERAVFVDVRRERHELTDRSSKGGSRELVIDPDVLADFSDLPFKDGTFALVVFDPPHLVHNGSGGWLAKKYGKLEGDWREMLRSGFAECFRVLREDGVLVFKWSDHDVPVREILELTPVTPLFGNRNGKTAKSHWIVFMKPRGNGMTRDEALERVAAWAGADEEKWARLAGALPRRGPIRAEARGVTASLVTRTLFKAWTMEGDEIFATLERARGNDRATGRSDDGARA